MSSPKRSPLGLIVLWQLFDGPEARVRDAEAARAAGQGPGRQRARPGEPLPDARAAERLGLVEVQETVRRRGLPRPGRLRDHRRRVARPPASGCARCCARPASEYPEFIAAVSILFGLEPEDARAQLEPRAEALAAELAERAGAARRQPRPAAAVPARGGVPAGSARGRARLAARRDRRPARRAG